MAENIAEAINRLIHEKSPYLQQHAHNPVDWRPWSLEALDKAGKEDKPLLISIGYASCHWCHVMERESFEDPETAGIMNDNFISIKIDREERPDLDSLYMKAVQAMTGRGGWPLTVFATPEGVPFYGGTYYPPEDGFGLPSFKKILLAVSLSYGKNRGRIDAVTSGIVKILKGPAEARRVELAASLADNALETAKLFFDPEGHGFGAEAKFPHAMFLKFLFRYWKRTGNIEAVSMIRKTLSAMALGGIYDHLGGGFHRYSVDAGWEVPHFEKMLYDNALLTEVYSLLFEASGAPLYKDAALETSGYLMREMRSPEGGFYTSMDADTGGREGSYYVWSGEEVESILGKEDGRKFIEYFSMTRDGNFDGKNTLRVKRPPGSEDAFALPISAEIKKMKQELFNARQGRRPPETDKKIIAGWNGLAISALAEASDAFKRADLIAASRQCAQFLLKGLRRDDGRIMRYWLNGKAGTLAGLEDYSLLGTGLMSLYEKTKEKRRLDEAAVIAGQMIDIFYDEKTGLFFDTGSDQERLFVRERDLLDNDVPSGNSAAAELYLRLFSSTGDKGYLDLAEKILSSIEGMRDEPMGYGNSLSALELYLKVAV